MIGRDWTASLRKFAPNVDVPALLLGSVFACLGLIPILAALDLIHQPDSAFPSGRPPAFIAGLVFCTGGLFLSVARGLGSTRFFKSFRQPLVLLMVSLMLFSFAAIPASMLALGTQGEIRVRGPFVCWTFHSPVLDKFVLSTLTLIVGGLAIVCLVDMVNVLRNTVSKPKD